MLILHPATLHLVSVIVTVVAAGVMSWAAESALRSEKRGRGSQRGKDGFHGKNRVRDPSHFAEKAQRMNERYRPAAGEGKAS